MERARSIELARLLDRVAGSTTIEQARTVAAERLCLCSVEWLVETAPPATPTAPQGPASDETPDDRERAIVRRLAGEWGEQEVGPIETLDDVVTAIHGAGTMFMRMVNEVVDWSYWARKHLGSKEHNDAKLRAALDVKLAATPPQGGAEPDPLGSPRGIKPSGARWERAIAAGRHAFKGHGPALEAIVYIEQLMLGHQPAQPAPHGGACLACGWAQSRHPEQHEEPPIVRGALDAQADAEHRAGHYRTLADAMWRALFPGEPLPWWARPA